MRSDSSLLPAHGGFRRLKTFQLATLIYDVTVLFCHRFVSRRSRTHDQMVQAARSGRQNIAEGSVDSGTSRKSELKLTGVARGSLEELRLDYEDFLRQHDQPQWPPTHPALLRFKEQRPATLQEFRLWVRDELQELKTDTDKHGLSRTNTDKKEESSSVSVRDDPCPSVSIEDSAAILAANGALSLLNLCLHLLGRQLAVQAEIFEQEGGFTERLYRIRTTRRAGLPQSGGSPRARR